MWIRHWPAGGAHSATARCRDLDEPGPVSLSSAGGVPRPAGEPASRAGALASACLGRRGLLRRRLLRAVLPAALRAAPCRGRATAFFAGRLRRLRRGCRRLRRRPGRPRAADRVGASAVGAARTPGPPWPARPTRAARPSGRSRRSGASSTSGGATISLPLDLGVDDLLQRRAVVVGELVRLEVGRPSTRSARTAMASSCGRTSTSSSRKSNSAARTSSGHSIVLSTSTPSRTRSVASCSRWRSATLTMATRSESVSASRSSTYGLVADALGLQVVRLVVEDRVDLLGRHELQHVDRAAAGQRQVGEVVVGEDHHLAAAEVVALGDVVVADLLAVRPSRCACT